ncbi:MAG: hypothetical protein GX581_08730 [Syntrophomonadaceae bacterium]|jgi:hypothetical protein|nr:hypothetical protein [Syntrophomonadaceae bacterium]NLN84453.1 hypothetical protein [Bacillota bacterium]
MLNTFLSDKKQDLGSLWSIKLRFSRFSDYQIKVLPELVLSAGNERITKNNVEIVAAVPPALKNPGPTFKIYTQASESVFEKNLEAKDFFEVMALTKDINLQKGFGPETEKAIPTEGILDLCRKYGFDFSFDDPIWQQHKIAGVELRHIKRKMFLLHWRFSVYAALYHEDFDMMRKVIPSSLIPTSMKEAGEDLLRAVAMDWLKQEAGGRANFELDFTPEGPKLDIITWDLFNACDVFLTLLITVGDAGGFKICANPDCRSFFMIEKGTGKGNKKYCDNCNYKTVWSRADRARKKVLKNT